VPRTFRELVDSFVPNNDPVVIGLDDTMEPNWPREERIVQGERRALALAHAEQLLPL
jgi:hypothetical protein